MKQIGTHGVGGAFAQTGRLMCRYINVKASIGYLNGTADFEEILLTEIQTALFRNPCEAGFRAEARQLAKIEVLRGFAKELETVADPEHCWKQFQELEADIQWRLKEAMFYYDFSE